MRRVPWFLGVAFVVAMFTQVDAMTSSAVAQAGSIGGTLGKTDKSASGGDEQIDSSVAHRRRPPARHSAMTERSTVGSCQGIVGTWKWPLGHDWVFDQNGSTHSTRGYTGNWRCDGGAVVINWSSGEIDHLTIAQDGHSFSNGTWTARRQ
jgi:hypothetical protein